MTSYDFLGGAVHSPSGDREKMREFRRPTLCVIDENGYEVQTELFPEIPRISITDLEPDLDNDKQHDHNANVTKVDTNYLVPDRDLTELKATTARLKLSTRRQSTVAWQQEHLETPKVRVKPNLKADVSEHNEGGFTEERKNRINEALAWLRSELLEMRSQDEILARTLLSLRHDIHQLKLQRSCAEHREMLDDIAQDMEEVNELNVISDIPLSDSVNDSPLKHLGVTRMHLSARRFSTC